MESAFFPANENRLPNPEKARRNLLKHGVTFETAREVWDDSSHVILPDRLEDGDRRWHAVGLVGSVVILLAVHTYADPDDEDRVRIMGARKATPHEKRRYEHEAS